MRTSKAGSRFSWRLRRADGVAVQVLLVVLVAAYAVVVPGSRLLAWFRGKDLVWESASSLDPAQVPGLSGPDVTVTYAGTVDWALHRASTGQWLAALAPELVTLGLLLVGCVLAARLVRSALAGEPFEAAGPGRLRILAVLVLAYGFLVPTLHVFASMAVLWTVDTSATLAWVLDPSSFGFSLVVGLVILVVAECFRIGQRLTDDVEGLV